MARGPRPLLVHERHRAMGDAAGGITQTGPPPPRLDVRSFVVDAGARGVHRWPLERDTADRGALG